MSASRFVCHNPDCGSRRQSFAHEKGYTMHFALSPSFYLVSIYLVPPLQANDCLLLEVAPCFPLLNVRLSSVVKHKPHSQPRGWCTCVVGIVAGRWGDKQHWCAFWQRLRGWWCRLRVGSHRRPAPNSRYYRWAKAVLWWSKVDCCIVKNIRQHECSRLCICICAEMGQRCQCRLPFMLSGWWFIAFTKHCSFILCLKKAKQFLQLDNGRSRKIVTEGTLATNFRPNFGDNRPIAKLQLTNVKMDANFDASGASSV